MATPDSNSFEITSDGNIVLNNGDVYTYVDRWSEQATWGG